MSRTLTILPLILLSAGGLTGGCDAEQPTVAAGSPAIEELPVQPAYTPAPTGVSLSHDFALSNVIVLGNTPWFYGQEGILRLSVGNLIPIEVSADLGSPASTGAVVAATHWGEELLFVAENGFFQSFEGHLIASPLTSELTDLKPLAVASAEDGTLWIGAEDGLYRLADGVASRVTYTGDTAVRAVAAMGNYVVAAYDGQAMVLDTEAFVWLTGPAVTLTALHSNDTQIVAASDTGVYTFEDAFEWTYRPTGAVSSVSSNPLNGQLYATTDDGVLAFEPDQAWHEANAYQAVNVGEDGNPWILSDASLEQLTLGQTTSFSGDIAPIFETACAGCHSDGYSAPLRDFTDYGVVTALFDTMFSRIATGQMPPGSPLSEDQIQSISDWYAGGFIE